MRVLLDKDSKKKLLEYLKQQNKANSLKELSIKIKRSKSTLENWFYNRTRYIPEKIIPKSLIKNIKIIDSQVDNWGTIKGGKKTYQILIEKYGLKEIKRRQEKGLKNSLLKIKPRDTFKININSPAFLEFYGILLGDGWLSSLSYQYKTKLNLWWIGISGHSTLDKDYLMEIKKYIEKVFERKATIKYKKNSKAMEIIFSHKQFILFMNKKLYFPIGKKNNLKIFSNIASDWKKIKHVIRGIFDTDGSLYFDKTPSKNPYPIISIHMNAPFLLNQIYTHLLAQGFKVRFRKNELILKGKKQLTKWMNEIGSNNSRHFLKYHQFIEPKVPVA